MTRKQTIVMWIGIVVFVLMGLYPPWTAQGAQGEIFFGYGLIIKIAPYPCRIDIDHLCVQWAIVAVITGGLIITVRDKKSPVNGPE